MEWWVDDFGCKMMSWRFWIILCFSLTITSGIWAQFPQIALMLQLTWNRFKLDFQITFTFEQSFIWCEMMSWKLYITFCVSLTLIWGIPPLEWSLFLIKALLEVYAFINVIEVCFRVQMNTDNWITLSSYMQNVLLL